MTKNFDQLIVDGFSLLLSQQQRQEMWDQVGRAFESIYKERNRSCVFNEELQSAFLPLLKNIDFKNNTDPLEVINLMIDALQSYQLNTTHPAYFGVFNPAPSSMSIIADAMVAFFNPQLASSKSGKFSIAIEEHLLSFFGQAFGYDQDNWEGIFTTGATEAINTALFCALNQKLPGFKMHGLLGLKQLPLIYCTNETHHSVVRAARLCGLGEKSLSVTMVDAQLKFDVGPLEEQIKKDIFNGHLPVFLVATLGSTSAGVIDPLFELATIANKYNIWFHVDAAFGGAAALLPEFNELKTSMALSDSIAFDPHKWLSVSMGCGMYLSRHRGILRHSFDVEESFYMPKEARHATMTEPYRQSMQWSRRFIGLKLFMTLMAHGTEGYQNALRHQMRMGQILKNKLNDNQWLIKNDTLLPVICFADEKGLDAESIVNFVTSSKRAFLTTTKLSHNNESVLRAGIPNFLTQEEHLDLLLTLLNDARR